jgi:hypothetical protein
VQASDGACAARPGPQSASAASWRPRSHLTARQAERRLEEAAEHEAQLALAQAAAPPAVEESALRRASDVARAEAAAAAAAAQHALRAQVEALERDVVRQRGELADARALAAERGARTAALEDKYAAAVQVSHPRPARDCAARLAPALPASPRAALRPEVRPQAVANVQGALDAHLEQVRAQRRDVSG